MAITWACWLPIANAFTGTVTTSASGSTWVAVGSDLATYFVVVNPNSNSISYQRTDTGATGVIPANSRAIFDNIWSLGYVELRRTDLSSTQLTLTYEGTYRGPPIAQGSRALVVSATGDDAAASAGAAPYATIEAALDAAEAGDTILIGEGTFAGYYSETLGNHWKDGITIIGAGKPKPNAANTALVGGTIVTGLFGVNAAAATQAVQGITIRSLGIDNGSARMLEVEEGGLTFHGSPTYAMADLVIDDCIGLGLVTGTLATSHGIDLDGVSNATVSNSGTIGFFHGCALKATGSQVVNFTAKEAYGSGLIHVGIDGSNPNHHNTLANLSFSGRSTVTALVIGADSHDLTVNGVAVTGVGTALEFRVTDSAVRPIERVVINGLVGDALAGINATEDVAAAHGIRECTVNGAALLGSDSAPGATLRGGVNLNACSFNNYADAILLYSTFNGHLRDITTRNNDYTLYIPDGTIVVSEPITAIGDAALFHASIGTAVIPPTLWHSPLFAAVGNTSAATSLLIDGGSGISFGSTTVLPQFLVSPVRFSGRGIFAATGTPNLDILVTVGGATRLTFPLTSVAASGAFELEFEFAPRDLPVGLGKLTLTGNAVAAETVTIGNKIYTWRAAPVTTEANAVEIAGTASLSIDNMIAAINGAAGSGTTYGSNTRPHEQVTAVAGTGDAMDLTATVTGFTIATTDTMTVGSWGAATLIDTIATEVTGRLTWGTATQTARTFATLDTIAAPVAFDVTADWSAQDPGNTMQFTIGTLETVNGPTKRY